MALTGREIVTLVSETDSARYLLRSCIEALRRKRVNEVNLHPVLTTGSIGLEKLLKLALGVHARSQGQPWPTRGSMQAYKHSSSRLYADVRAAINASSTPSPVAAQLMAAVDADPLVPLLLDVFSNYGGEGRFFILDAMSGNPQKQPNPAGLWQELENRVYELTNPSVPGSGATNAQWDALPLGISGFAADSLQALWEAIAQALYLGVLGKDGEGIGHELLPVNAFAVNP